MENLNHLLYIDFTNRLKAFLGDALMQYIDSLDCLDAYYDNDINDSIQDLVHDHCDGLVLKNLLHWAYENIDSFYKLSNNFKLCDFDDIEQYLLTIYSDHVYNYLCYRKDDLKLAIYLIKFFNDFGITVELFDLFIDNQSYIYSYDDLVDLAIENGYQLDN